MVVPNHLDLITPYFDHYYTVLADMIRSRSISQAKAQIFMTHICPMLARSDASQDLQKINDLLKLAEDLEKEGMALSSYKNFFKEYIYYYNLSAKIVIT